MDFRLRGSGECLHFYKPIWYFFCAFCVVLRLLRSVFSVFSVLRACQLLQQLRVNAAKAAIAHAQDMVASAGSLGDLAYQRGNVGGNAGACAHAC